MLHIYYGDGKGKTSAALGLGLRACGRGMHVLLLLFLKGRDTGELKTIERIPEITVLDIPETIKFVPNMTKVEKAETAVFYTSLFQKAMELVKSGLYSLVILDEVLDAIELGIVDEEKICTLLNAHPDREFVLTGRKPPPSFLEAADYVSEIKKRKHPFDRGIPARLGIEF